MTASPSSVRGERETSAVARALPALVLFVATFAAFAPVLSAEFVAWDDDANFLLNHAYRGLGAEHLRWMFTTFHMGPYQPLSWLTLGVDHQLWGMDARGYHATNVFVHALTAVALYCVARRLFALVRESVSERDSMIASFVAAAAFALHPLRVESVGWVTERRDVLSGLFFVLAVGAWLRYGSEGRSRSYWTAFAFVLLSLGAKAMAIVAPAVFVLLDVWPLARTRLGWKRLALEQLPFVGLSVLFGWLAIRGQAAQGATLLSVEQHGFAQRVAQVAYGLVFYPWRTLVPVNLGPLYELPVPFDPATARFVVPIVLVVVTSIVLFVMRRRVPGVFAAWIAFAIVLSPVSGITQAGAQLVADRYSYASCIPFALLFGGIVIVALRARPDWRHAIIAAACVIPIVLAALTFAQSRHWQNSEALWRHALAIEPNSPNALLNLGSVSMRKGADESDPSKRDALFDEAAALFEKGIRVRPMPEMHVDLGLVTLFRAQSHAERAPVLLPEALNQIRRGIALGEEQHYVKPMWRLHLGTTLLTAGRCDEAVAVLESVLPILPETEAELRSLSLAYTCVGRKADALEILERAIALEPDDSTLWLRAGDLNADLGRKDEARVSFENVIALRNARLGSTANADPDVIHAQRALAGLK